jgi:hypothetical protein
MKKIVYSLFLLIVTIFSFTTNNCNAQWVFSNGPYSGDGRCFLVTPSVVHAGTNGHGTLYSPDNGIHWYSSGNVGLTNQNVNCFIQIGANFFAGTNGGVFLSTNSGGSWFGVNTGLGNSPVKTFALIGSTLFAGTTGGIYQTTDNGALWTYVGYGIGNSNINSLLALNNVLYAGTAGGGVFKSTDNGNTWSSANFGLINQNINILFASGNVIYAGTSASASTDGLYKTTNYGVNWLLSGLQNLNVYTLVLNSGNLYAGTNAGVYRSSNGGINWSSALGLQANSVYSLNNAGNNILAGTNEGFAASTNGGAAWDYNGYMAMWVNYFTSSSTNLFTASGSYGVWTSSNSGNSWYSVNNGLPFLRIMSLTNSGSTVYAAYTNNNLTQNGIYKTTNNGAEWVYFYNTISRTIRTMKSRSQYFYIGLFFRSSNSGLYFSSDSGQSFMPDYSLYNVSVSDVEFQDANEVYITTGNVLRSTNNGVNWSTVYSAGGVNELAVSGNYIFGGTGNGVIMSTNDGLNWNSIGMTGKTINAIEVYQNNIIVSTQDSGFYLTNNYGGIWHKKNQGITVSPIYNTCLYIYNSYIFSGIGNIGAWRRNLSEIISIQNISAEIPEKFSLSQNYPNPFNPSTKISFAIPKSSIVRIAIFDITGKEIEVLVNEQIQPGTYETTWNASAFSSGLYFCRMTTGNYTETKKMLLIK